MARSISAREKRLAELKKEVTRRGFDRHASRLSVISELPIELKSPAVTELANCEEIRTIILFPQQIQRGWHYVPKQALLFTATGVIHILASIWPNEEPQITSINACELMYMKVTLLLLYGFLEIVAQGPSLPIRIGMEFNTVAWYFLAAPLKQFLQATQGRSNIPAEVFYSPSAKQSLEKLPFKFKNGVKLYGLLPGEELEELVFQPAIWRRWLYFFRQPVTADTLLMLTSHYMVLIQEDIKVRQGWILSYLPRNSICGIQNQPFGLWSELAFQLRAGDQAVDCKLLLGYDAVEAWRSQWVQHGGQWQDLSV